MGGTGPGADPGRVDLPSGNQSGDEAHQPASQFHFKGNVDLDTLQALIDEVGADLDLDRAVLVAGAPARLVGQHVLGA